MRRFRRLRGSEAMRRLVRETRISAEEMIYPIFVIEGEDIREELFLAFSHADVPMLTLNQSKTTLEEIFLELTQGSGNRMIKEEK